MMQNAYRFTVVLATALALTVTIMGAWVRLGDAGLGCPDWPGCYGQLIVPSASDEVAAAESAFPERPLEADKAWKEMIHRYAATLLGLSILCIAFFAWRNREDPGQNVLLPLLLVGVVIFQGILGMWTVTLLLKPVIVMGHLLGGLTTLGMLFWLLLDIIRPPSPPRRAATLAVAGLCVLIGQISLGGWTSANYAALACPDLPTCNGQWWPEEANFAEGFVMWRGLGVNYEFGVLDAPSRVAIHLTHRLGAIITFLFLGAVALRFLKSPAPVLQRGSVLVLIALAAQILIGLGVVWFGLPLTLATAHNGVAAILLLTVINLNHAAAETATAPT